VQNEKRARMLYREYGLEVVPYAQLHANVKNFMQMK
jgi:hypothetical protein